MLVRLLVMVTLTHNVKYAQSIYFNNNIALIH